MKKGLYKRKIICYNSSCSAHLALWCSRLARQPVTLEVDGSSPFGVAMKKASFVYQTKEAFFKRSKSTVWICEAALAGCEVASQ